MSIGSVVIQIGIAVMTLGVDPNSLTHELQFCSVQCLLNDSFNVRAVAFHLHDLILFDNVSINTAVLID